MLLKKNLLVVLLATASIFSSFQQAAYAHVPGAVIASDTTITDSILSKCPKGKEVEKIIEDAIAMGAPIYNAGIPLACYRIYEGAAYKILYEYGKTCKEVEKLLKAAVDKSHGDYSDIEKAWIMRAAFDKIMGVPTETRAREPDRVG